METLNRFPKLSNDFHNLYKISLRLSNLVFDSTQNIASFWVDKFKERARKKKKKKEKKTNFSVFWLVSLIH